MTVAAVSPHGGPVKERQALSARFASRLSTSESLNRQIVSYQGNRKAPGLRWMKYKEGFSSQLVADLIEQEEPRAVLDPFAGICTTPLIAAGLGRQATGIEIMPVGVLAGSAIAEAANGLSRDAFGKLASALLQEVKAKEAAPDFAFPHVRITKGAFSRFLRDGGRHIGTRSHRASWRCRGHGERQRTISRGGIAGGFHPG